MTDRSTPEPSRRPITRRQTLTLALLLLLGLVVGLCSGCAAPRQATAYETVEVAVPIAVPCPAVAGVELPPPSELPVSRLDSAATPKDVARAYAATVRILLTDVVTLRLLLGAVLKAQASPVPPLQPVDPRPDG